MAYTFPIDPAEFFVERGRQMLVSGLDPADCEAVRAAIKEMWPDAPGGWTYEWSALAQKYVGQGRHDLAALAYGWARFPTLATPAMRTAMENQLKHYLLAAPGFPVGFERRVLDVPHLGGRTPVAVHIFTPAGLAADAPVLIVSGGVDGWKMDVHGLLIILAQMGVSRVMAFDLPGTGESQVPMTSDGGADMLGGLVAEARRMGARKVAYLGISMGGHYAARAGLAGQVDAAVDFGGPVGAREDLTIPTAFGMYDIVANALGFDHRPDAAEWAARTAPFSLRALLAKDDNVPMLVINGADDVHVPQEDTLVFRGRRDTEVHLLPDTGHCAPSKMPEAMMIIATWLRAQLES